MPYIPNAQISAPNGGGGIRMGYGEKTSSTSITANTENGADIVATATAVVLDGLTLIRVEAYSPAFVSPSANSLVLVLFAAKDGAAAASLGDWGSFVVATASTSEILTSGGLVARYLTPAAGTWVYSLRAYTNTGTGTIIGGTGVATASAPAFIAVVSA